MDDPITWTARDEALAHTDDVEHDREADAAIERRRAEYETYMAEFGLVEDDCRS